MPLGEFIQVVNEGNFAAQVWALLWECCQECPVLVCCTNTSRKKVITFSCTWCQNNNKAVSQQCQYKPALCLRILRNYLKCLTSIALSEQEESKPRMREVLSLLNRTIIKEMCEGSYLIQE